MSTIQSEHFTKALLMLLTETFENVSGYYLDEGTSLFETLAGISAEEASIPVGGKCATLAAQVKHVAFYLDLVDKSVKDPNYPRVDWTEIWNNVNVVNDAEWQEIQDELRRSYATIQDLVNTTPAWPSEREIGGAMGLLAHSAYHLGEIRQALCTLKS
jgi:hypothetical protein